VVISGYSGETLEVAGVVKLMVFTVSPGANVTVPLGYVPKSAAVVGVRPGRAVGPTDQLPPVVPDVSPERVIVKEYVRVV